MNIDDMIKQSREMAECSREVAPEVAKDNEQLAEWLDELKLRREARIAGVTGISICILTYNVFFYNRLAIRNIRAMTKLIPYEILVFDNGSDDGSTEWLAAQPDVNLVRRTGEYQLRHGGALDYMVRHLAKYPICCTLCSDAFPTSPEWIAPAFHLSDEVFLSGVERGWGRVLPNYVCPSYLFGWTDFLKNHSFLDEWPTTDTGEAMTKACFDAGKKVHYVPFKHVEFDGKFKPKNCDYSGLVWHVWWGGRYKTSPWVLGTEVEQGYHEFMMDYLRAKYNLDF
jgi:glycosyltransferase involved in cell wall biosynthesis